MNKIDTDDLRRIVAEATPGPWQQGEMVPNLVFAWNLPPDHEGACICDVCDASEDSEANAALIALAPDLAAEILASRAREADLQAEVARLREALNVIATQQYHRAKAGTTSATVARAALNPTGD